MRKVCFWKIRDEYPTFIMKGLGRQLYRLEVWAKVERVDGYELLETTFMPKKPVMPTDLSHLAGTELTQMIAGETVIDAGFEIYIRGTQK